MPTRTLAIAVCLLLTPVAIWAQDQPKETPKTPPDLNLPLREGEVRISGRATAKSVIVRVYSGWTEDATDSALAKATASLAALKSTQADASLAERQAITCRTDEPVATVGPTTISEGKFDVLLPRRLNGGDCVVVENDAASGGRATSAVAQSVILDLGRLRGYFSLGGAVSRNREAFAKTDNFVGFTVDARIIGLVVEKGCEDLAKGETSPVCQATGDEFQPLRQSLRLRKFRLQANAFADARVGFKLAATGTTGAATATTGGTPATPPFQRPDQLVFNSEQPGFFQVGMHFPFSTVGMDWRNNGRLYSFYLGPVGRFGAQTFGTPVIRSRTVEIDLTKPATDTARFAVKRELSETGAQPFYGIGARMGVFGYDLLGRALRHRQVANDPVGYLDITWGRSTGFPTYTFTRTTNADGKIETIDIQSVNNRRLSVEGRMKIPYLPALVGVDYNVRANSRSDEPNDLRFTIAFRVDAQKALGRIFTGDALTQDR